MTAGLSLVIESSTYEGSVALLDDAVVIGSGSLPAQREAVQGTRAELLLPEITACLSRAGVKVESISRIIVGNGPGSFTSLRIGGSLTKGLCHALGIPLFSVSSLTLIAAGAQLVDGERCVALLDAMRKEWYGQSFLRINGATIPEEPMMLYALGDIERLENEGRVTAGPGQRLDVGPRATACANILPQILDAGPEALDSWEPAYGRLAEAQARWETEHGRALKS